MTDFNILPEKRKPKFDEGLAEKVNKEAEELIRKGLLEDKQPQPISAGKIRLDYKMKIENEGMFHELISDISFCNNEFLSVLSGNGMRVWVYVLDYRTGDVQLYTQDLLPVPAVAIDKWMEHLSYAVALQDPALEFHYFGPSCSRCEKARLSRAPHDFCVASRIAVSYLENMEVYEYSKNWLGRVKLKRAAECEGNYKRLDMNANEIIAVPDNGPLDIIRYQATHRPTDFIDVADSVVKGLDSNKMVCNKFQPEINASDAAFSLNRQLVAVSFQDTVSIYSRITHEKVFEMKENAERIAFSTDSSYLATAGADSVKIYKVNRE
jgi:hypothetical protein